MLVAQDAFVPACSASLVTVCSNRRSLGAVWRVATRGADLSRDGEDLAGFRSVQVNSESMAMELSSHWRLSMAHAKAIGLKSLKSIQ